MLNKIRSTIAGDSLLPLIIKGLGAIVAFALSVVMARTLGIEQFGAYFVVISALVVLSIPVQAGVPILPVREVSKAMARSDLLSISILQSWYSRFVFNYF